MPKNQKAVVLEAAFGTAKDRLLLSWSCNTSLFLALGLSNKQHSL